MDNTLQDFLETVAGILEVPSVTSDTDFRACPVWDSLTGFALIVMIGQKYGKRLDADALRAMKTVGELADFAGVAR